MLDQPDIPGPPNRETASRAISDANGTGWTVWSISSGTLPPKLSRLLGTDVEVRGALLFVSESNEWRVLTPAPADWLELTESALEACRVRARVVRSD